MELYQLKTFTMVAEEGHLTRAAKRLNASQPAVSAHIKALEDELGINLFMRTPRGMTLTADGVQLKKHADKALAVIDEMVAHAGTLRGTISGDLRIGINTEPDSLRIPELFSTLQSQYPHLQLHLLQSMTGDALDRLEAGELDGAFIYGRSDSDKIFANELQLLKLVVAGPAKWRKRIEDADPEGLEDFPWITTPADCPFHMVMSELFRMYGLSPDEVASVDQESTIKTMIKAGVGLSLVLEQDIVQESEQDDYAVWDKEDLNLTLSIACLKRRKDEPRLQALFSVLSRVWEPIIT
jgi:DNA-binding transcriptional LysR family regulator